VGLLDQVKGFGQGAWDGAKNTWDGLKGVVTDPIGTAKGIGHAVTHPGEAVDAFTKPYRDAWSKGEYGRAIGMGTVEAITAVVGAKGADKLAKTAKAAKAARAARAADELADAGRAANAARVTTAVARGITESAEAQAATAKALSHVPGETRLAAAAAHRAGWPVASLEDAVKKLGKVDIQATESGKVLYTSKETGVRVVHDPHSKYFRVEDPSIPGKRNYLDANGNRVPNNITDPATGKQRGMTQAEYNQRTHFRTD
jgi:hypothetical protein